jgi:hypothetical protein
MGQRANLLLKHRKGYELYYSHWRANSLDCDLFWGPDAAIDFIRRQRSVADGAVWLDEVWAEGGAVVDLDERVVLWFGGEDVLYDVPRRRLHLALMSDMWPGWEVRWAHEHIFQIANYVGEAGDDLLRDETAAFAPTIHHPEEPDWMSFVLSIHCADGRWKLHAFDASEKEAALAGPGWAAALGAADLPGTYDYAARTGTFPQGGLHIEEATRRVDVWLAPAAAAFERRLRVAWPGWDVRWHRDHFESVTEQLGARLVLPVTDAEVLVSHVRANVLRPPRDHSGLVQELSGHPAHRAGAPVSINPFAQRDDVRPAAGPEQARALDAAIERWRERR